MSASFDDILAAARKTQPSDYLSQHLRAWAKVDPRAVAEVLRQSPLTDDQRADVARELGVTL